MTRPSFAEWRRDNSGTLADYQRLYLTPYDTGARAEPKVWEERHRESEEDYGKVDFNTDEDYTVATLWIERRESRGFSGYVLKGYTNEPLEVEIDDQT